MRFTLGLVLLSSLVQATLAANSTRCSDLQHYNFGNNTSITSTTLLPSGSNFTGSSIEPSYNTPQLHLPALCRIHFTVQTSPNSSANAEIWLPTPSKWQGRFLAVGNGGFAGGINFPDVVWGLRKGFASMSTNTGHESSQGDGRWMLGDGEGKVDFGHRALHETTLVAKSIVSAYYGSPAKWSYYVGCSTGGRQGLAASQRFPQDYDGILVGSAIASQTNTSAWQDWVALEQFPKNRTSWIPKEIWEVVYGVVMEQCDYLDGVEDGSIVDPRRCRLDFSTLLCNSTTSRPTSADITSCLTPPQISNLHRLYAGWPAIAHPGLSPGGEMSFSYLMNSATPQFGPEFYRYAVFNDSDWDWSTLTSSDVALANEINPGGMNAYSLDGMRAFGEKGGKVLQYHGWADPLIPSLTAPNLYNSVSSFYESLDRSEEIDSFYRLFMVPGMGHCNGGSGAWVLDAAGQSGITPPNNNGSEFSMLWSLVDWVEKGKEPDEIVGTKYVNDTASLGVQFQRPVCKWPKVAEYVEENGSWKCP